jgi:hypothetical protein
MADDAASLDIVIRTRAELDGAQEAEAQLDQILAQAGEPGIAGDPGTLFDDGSPGPAGAAGEPGIAGSREMESQTEAMQAVGTRLQAALTQNGQATVALLDRTLALVEEQTRQFAEVERRIEQLTTQIKGLKNP